MVRGKSEYLRLSSIIQLYRRVSIVVINSLLATLNSRYALKGDGVRRDPSTVTTDHTTTNVPTSTPVRTILTEIYAVSDLGCPFICLVSCSSFIHLSVAALKTDWGYHQELSGWCRRIWSAYSGSRGMYIRLTYIVETCLTLVCDDTQGSIQSNKV